MAEVSTPSVSVHLTLPCADTLPTRLTSCAEPRDGITGPQPGSTVHDNYVHSQCEKYGVLYHDGGSGWW